jgi:hypothetical protein
LSCHALIRALRKVLLCVARFHTARAETSVAAITAEPEHDSVGRERQPNKQGGRGRWISPSNLTATNSPVDHRERCGCESGFVVVHRSSHCSPLRSTRARNTTVPEQARPRPGRPSPYKATRRFLRPAASHPPCTHSATDSPAAGLSTSPSHPLSTARLVRRFGDLGGAGLVWV